MKKVQITVEKIAQTKINWPAVVRWLESVGVKAPESILAQLAQGTDLAALIALAGKRCYNSFEVGLNPNVSKIRADMEVYVENILKSGHGSVLEHATATFAMEGVTRVFTAEMNRHRAGIAISEGSLRYIRFDDIPYWEPPEIATTEEERVAVAAECLRISDPAALSGPPHPTSEMRQRAHTQTIFQRAFQQDEDNYKELCQLWGIEDMKDFNRKKQLTSMFRRIIGMGVSTGGVWTGNVRAWRHILALRTSMGAETEIRVVLDLIAKDLVETEPMLFCDFEQNDKGEWVPRYPKV